MNFTDKEQKEKYKEALRDIEYYGNGDHLCFYLDVQTEQLCKLAVTRYGKALEYVKDEFQTEEICKLAVEENGLALQFVKNKTKNVCNNAVYNNGLSLQFVNEEFQTDEICKFLVGQSYIYDDYDGGRYVDDVLDIEKNICELAVTKNGLALEYVKKQTKELCKLAVQQNGLALQFVNEEFQTDEIYILAVQQNGLALKFVKKQTEEISKLAILKFGEYPLLYINMKKESETEGTNKINELDINLELLDNNGNKYFHNRDIRYNEREEMKTKLLANVEVIDKDTNSVLYCKEDNLFFCRLLKNMFGFEIGNYILFAFADDKNFYHEEDFGYEGCNEFTILYLKNKEELSNFEINNNLWKDKMWYYSKNQKIHYNTKQINIKIKCKLVLEYFE
jgi:hypothetical protein